jgi:hypothetical protein
MKIDFTDSQRITFTFDFNGADVWITSNGSHKPMAMPIEQITRNSEPWQFAKNEYIKMSPDAIVFIEKYCQNKAFW